VGLLEEKNIKKTSLILCFILDFLPFFKSILSFSIIGFSFSIKGLPLSYLKLEFIKSFDL
jgi:hypothetical protein